MKVELSDEDIHNLTTILSEYIAETEYALSIHGFELRDKRDLFTKQIAIAKKLKDKLEELKDENI